MKPENHERQAEHNAELAGLLGTEDNFVDWHLTATFYEAVHLVEKHRSVHATGPAHSQNHDDRKGWVENQMPGVWDDFKNLYEASRIARYVSRHSTFLTAQKRAFAESLRTKELARIREFVSKST
jgi:hypothetical protein